MHSLPSSLGRNSSSVSTVEARKAVHWLYYSKWYPLPSGHTHTSTPCDVSRNSASKKREKNGSLSANPVFTMVSSLIASDTPVEPSEPEKPGMMTQNSEQLTIS